MSCQTEELCIVVRIRLERGSPARTLRARIRRIAIVCAALLTPAALMAWALGGWRLLADLNGTGDFAIRDTIALAGLRSLSPSPFSS